MEHAQTTLPFTPVHPEVCYAVFGDDGDNEDGALTPLQQAVRAETFGNTYAKHVPDITYEELSLCIDRYLAPAMLPDLREALVDCAPLDTIRRIGLLAVCIKQTPHPSMHEPLRDAIFALDTTVPHINRGLIEFYTKTGDIARAKERLSKHPNARQFDISDIAHALGDSVLEPAQKATYAKEFIEELSSLSVSHEHWKNPQYRDLFGVLYAHDPIEAVRLATGTQKLTALLLGMLDNNQLPPASLREAIKPYVSDSVFLRRDILEAYVKIGDLETAHQCLTEELAIDDKQESSASMQIQMLTTVVTAALEHSTEKPEEETDTYDLLRVAAESPAGYLDTMRPYALIKKTLVQKGWPDVVEAFARMRMKKPNKPLSIEARQDVILAHVYADNLDMAEELVEKLPKEQYKAFVLKDMVEALYDHCPDDPTARANMVRLAHKAYTTFKAAGYPDKALGPSLSLIPKMIDDGHIEFANQLQTIMGPGHLSDDDKVAVAIARHDRRYDHLAAMAEDYHSFHLMVRAIGESVRAEVHARNA